MQTAKVLASTATHKIESWQKRSPFIILILASIVGAATGLLGSLFHICINYTVSYREQFLQHVEHASPYLSYFLIFCITAVMGAFAYYLVQRFAPETGGSGIPEVEGALLNLRPVRWWRVIPVKFFGGLGALGSGMVLGREGPTVQIGANLGKMTADLCKVKNNESLHTLIATGAGAGITAAFNAPLSGILFVIEEMRPEFTYTKASIKAVFVGCITSCMVYQFIMGSNPILDMGTFLAAPLKSVWIYIFLGLFLGLIGSLSNSLILTLRRILGLFYQKKQYFFPLTGAVLAGTFGVLSLLKPEMTGGGFAILPNLVDGMTMFYPLLILLCLRFIATILCFGSGAPGGIFAPTIALGAIIGVLFGMIAQPVFPQYDIELLNCAVLGMAGLFAATIRAPLTGIMVVMEMTGSFVLILPLIITCLAATFMAQTLGATPIYSAILNSTLASSKNEPDQSKEK
ncbi:H(+)/Cl(-) exchange transporter ClcA [Acinetobacter pecorum]